MSDSAYVVVHADGENNAETWWAALDARYPKLAAALRRNHFVKLSRATYDALAALPGFADGPEYAPTALMTLGDDSREQALETPGPIFDVAE